ncbi:response regulator [Neorhizobium sp. NCHU2750]|uniref:response regulator transcription factor n=1 Tax=Neorhizobium sp. NCHU2750 TaxID=1825976 RepID=UPI000EB6277E|nr:hypothetical protein NCHU2750_31290 [Neorhizobium sp. NCHU2750]
MKAPVIISIIDDEENVRRGISSLLRSHGYEVNTFASAESFLASSAVGNCSCVVSDLHMGGMNGIELFHTLRSRDSRLPFIFVTAFADDVLRLKLVDDICVLPKPFRAECLIESIARATRPTT